MFGNVDLNEWYNNYYWYIEAGFINGREHYVTIFISDREFSVYQSGSTLYASGNINSYRKVAGYGNIYVNLNWFKGEINISEPTLTNSTNPKFTDLPVNISRFSNFDIKYTNGNTYLSASNPRIINPILTNTQTELENLSFNNFNVEAKSYSNQDVYMLFYNRSLSNSQNTDGLYPISTKLLTRQSIYYDTNNSTDNNAIYNVPIWKTGVLFNIGSTYEIKFAIINGFDDENNVPLYSYIGDTYSFTISSNVTQDYINQLNQQTATTTNEDNQQEQLNAINNQTQSIDNINTSITDSTVDNSSIGLPTDNTQDPTQSGIDNIFQTIYNGFTSGTPQNIVFPIPYSEHNITIEPNYISNMLNTSERRKSYYITYSSLLLVFN